MAGEDTAHEWEARWREGVDRNIATLTTNQQHITLSLEGVSSRLQILEGKPAETRQWFQMFTSGGGCLYMLLAFAAMIVLNLITIGVSVILTLALR